MRLLPLFVLLAPGKCLRIHDAPSPRVPFYMYELPSWTQDCDPEEVFHQNWYPDYALHQTLKEHPWRVQDASAAKLLVVPGYFGMSKAGKCGQHTDNMMRTVAFLESQSFFKSRLRDHVFSCFHWKCKPSWLGPFSKYAVEMIWAYFENRPVPNFRPVVVPYGPVSVRGGQDLDHGPKNHSLFMIGQADKRWAYKERQIAIGRLPDGFNDTILATSSKQPWTPLPDCEPGVVETRCKMPHNYEDYVWAGVRSRFSLVIHGDSPSTSRLYDAISFKQLPIFISDGWDYYAAPFRNDLPWKDMGIFVSQFLFDLDPVGRMRDAMHAWESNRSRQELWRRMAPFLDWSLQSPCMGMAFLSDAARRHLGMALPPAWQRDECQAGDAAGLVRRAKSRALHLNETKLREVIMRGRLLD